MAAPAMSQLICSMALVALILVLPSFFAMERNSLTEEMAKTELTEISDYTSNTLENLFLLAKSTSSEKVTITKELVYLPLRVEGSAYTLRLTFDQGTASRVTAFLNDKPWVESSSWLAPGMGLTAEILLEINDNHVVAGCEKQVTGEGNVFTVWIEEGA